MKKHISTFGLTGLNTDINPSLLPENAVTSAINVVTDDASLSSVKGESKLFDFAISLSDLDPTSAAWSTIEGVEGTRLQVVILSSVSYTSVPPPDFIYLDDTSTGGFQTSLSREAQIGDALIYYKDSWYNKGPNETAVIYIEPIYHTSFLHTDQTQWFIVSDGEDVVAFDTNGSAQIITPTVDGLVGSDYLPFIDSFVSMTKLNGVLIVNSELSGPHYWSGPSSPATPLIQLPGPGDNSRQWLSGAGTPSSGLGNDGDYYRDTSTILASEPAFSGTWYIKQSGSWVNANTVGGTVEYGWNWTRQWRCNWMDAYRYYLVGIGMSEQDLAFPSFVRWSDSVESGAIPIQWAPLTSNNAGYDVLGETPGKLIAAVKVRDSLFLIKEDSIYQMRWIGGQYVMSITRLQGTIGTSVRTGCIEMQGAVIIFTSTDLLLFDGQQQFSLTDGRVKDGIFDGISPSKWDNSRLFYFEPTGKLFVSFVSAGYEQLSDSLVYDATKKVWGHKKLKNSYGFDIAFVNNAAGIPTWDELGTVPAGGEPPVGWQSGEPWDSQTKGSWNQGAYQSSSIDLVEYESNNTDEISIRQYWLSLYGSADTDSDGTSKYCEVQRTGLPLLEGSREAQINKVWIDFSGDAELSVRIGVQDSINGQVTWALTKDNTPDFIVSPGSKAFIDPIISGFYIVWRVSSETNKSWKLSGITFDLEDAGE